MILSSRVLVRLSRSALLVAVACLAGAPVLQAAKGKARAEPTYRGAIVMDAASGQVLFENNADDVGAPASMTKLMTYAVLHDKLAAGTIALDTPVKIDVADTKMGGTQVYLDPRETFTVEELVYAMMIQSANDAAHALARAAAGSRDAFVDLMNAKAREIGMTHSTFRSPHGLPPSTRRTADGDITTPRDFAVLCRYLLLHTDVLRYTSVREREFAPNRAKGPIDMINHNKLLGKVAGVDGLKTGYTADAGYCLSATAERQGRRVVVVIMGAFGPGGQRDRGVSRDVKAIELLETGFSKLATGGASFDEARAKYVKPATISLDGPPASPPPAPAPDLPSIKFPVPRK